MCLFGKPCNFFGSLFYMFSVACFWAVWIVSSTGYRVFLYTVRSILTFPDEFQYKTHVAEISCKPRC